MTKPRTTAELRAQWQEKTGEQAVVICYKASEDGIQNSRSLYSENYGKHLESLVLSMFDGDDLRAFEAHLWASYKTYWAGSDRNSCVDEWLAAKRKEKWI